ncbi:TonB-dependent receptor domain-containing protein [Rheinheimera faecalis]|uniref:TonB-dependent receptor domain-containing protein n=1 Tax=Rheinheimera faecalis TaxID=2901141 RepID=UPI001E62C617|nr:TonB-dependent receptor [Rheinheimera faecalis]
MRPSLFQLSPLAVLVASVFSAQVQAQSTTINGLVLDTNGQAIEQARVHVHGRQQYVYADNNGRFTIQAPADAELHISAKGYGDQFVKVSDAQSDELKIQLQAGGLERIVVAASGLHHYDLEMANPVSVLSGEELSRKTEPTIGETLKSMPGVHSNYYGPVAASPILRGLDGPRVRILSNGLDSADVSRIGPDHAISADAITTEQIEVLRGPSTLLYGSGAVGGVVNVVDNRLPRQLRPASTQIETRYSSGADEKTAALAHDGGQEQIAWHFDGFKRKTNNYDVPDFMNDEGESSDQLANSWLDNSAVNGGLSWITDKGLLGFSIGHIDSEYGIPGHHHHHEEHEEDEHEEEEGHEEAGVFARVKQDRYGLAGELYKPFAGIETLSFSSALTRYQHHEIEGGAIGTTFKNDSFESRFTAEHETFAGWHGVVGYHLQQSDYKAIGEEAFTPDTKTDSHSLFVLEERSFGDFTAQLGARIEQVDYKASGIEFEHHHDEDEAEEHHAENVKNDFTAASVSAGLVWNFQPGYNWALSVSRSERAPSAAELYSNGAHIATQTYELGLAYALDADGEITQSETDFKKEVANNIDLTLRKFEGDFTFTYNLFYNKVHNYLYMKDSGLTMADLEAHDEEDHEEDHDHEHEGEEFSVFHYQQQDATLYGAEFAMAYQLTPEQELEFFIDSVRAKLDNGGDLPRIPPIKVGTGYSYSAEDWSATIDWTHYMKQNRVAAGESATGSYQILDLGFSYYFNLNDLDLTAFAKANNLTDELGFVHSSFIKEDAPLPGRSFTLGLKARF